jgi:hypothetical protein
MRVGASVDVPWDSDFLSEPRMGGSEKNRMFEEESLGTSTEYQL